MNIFVLEKHGRVPSEKSLKGLIAEFMRGQEVVTNSNVVCGKMVTRAVLEAAQEAFKAKGTPFGIIVIVDGVGACNLGDDAVFHLFYDMRKKQGSLYQLVIDLLRRDGITGKKAG
jgi:hypothetical protein